MNTHYERGQILTDQGRYELAIQEFLEALAIDPDHAWTHGYLAWCFEYQQQYAEALTAVQTAIGLDPDESRFHYFHARIFVALDQLTEAKAAIDNALELDPEDPDYYGCRAQIHYYQGDNMDAQTTAEEGLAIDPEHQFCQEMRLLALYQMNPKDCAEIRAEAENMLAIHPQSSQAHSVYAWACLNQMRVAEAEKHFREALRLSPDYKWARAGLIESLMSRHLLHRLLIRLDNCLEKVYLEFILFILLRLGVWFLFPVVNCVFQLTRTLVNRFRKTLFTFLLSFNKEWRMLFSPAEIKANRLHMASLSTTIFIFSLAIIYRQNAWIVIPCTSILIYLLLHFGESKSKNEELNPIELEERQLRKIGLLIAILGILLALFYRQIAWLTVPCAIFFLYSVSKIAEPELSQENKDLLLYFAVPSSIACILWLNLGLWSFSEVILVQVLIVVLFLPLACLLIGVLLGLISLLIDVIKGNW